MWIDDALRRTWRASVALLLLTMPVSLASGGEGQQTPTFTDLERFSFELGDTASVDGGKVPLSGGKWQDPAVGGSTFALHAIHAIGDLDGDRVADAAALLVETSPAGAFTYLFALLNRDGRLTQPGPPEWLGDGTVVERLTIDGRGTVIVRFLTHKDSDRACCPTLRIEDRYRVQNGRLIGITK